MRLQVVKAYMMTLTINQDLSVFWLFLPKIAKLKGLDFTVTTDLWHTEMIFLYITPQNILNNYKIAFHALLNY